MAGRPSKALERRDEILDAMEICVREQGLALASMRRIAEQSGLSLQMISHYFGNRKSLILAFVERITEHLLVEIDQADTGGAPKERLHNAIRFLSSGQYKQLTGNDVIGREIWGMAERDEEVRHLVWNAYDRWLDQLASMISKAYPYVAPEQARTTAYAILCLIEANEFFSGIGKAQVPAASTQKAAMDLLSLLEQREPATAGAESP